HGPTGDGGPTLLVIEGLPRTTVPQFDGTNPAQRQAGIEVAVGDVSGDGIPDVVSCSSVGGVTRVRVFDGLTGAPLPGFFGGFPVYAPLYQGPVNVAAGDVNADGFDDVITAPQQGGGPHVKVFSGRDGSLLFSFMAYSDGVRVGV